MLSLELNVQKCFRAFWRKKLADRTFASCIVGSYFSLYTLHHKLVARVTFRKLDHVDLYSLFIHCSLVIKTQEYL